MRDESVMIWRGSKKHRVAKWEKGPHKNPLSAGRVSSGLEKWVPSSMMSQRVKKKLFFRVGDLLERGQAVDGQSIDLRRICFFFCGVSERLRYIPQRYYGRVYILPEWCPV